MILDLATGGARLVRGLRGFAIFARAPVGQLGTRPPSRLLLSRQGTFGGLPGDLWVLPDGATINDGDSVTVDDGLGHSETFEADKTGDGVAPGNIDVDVDPGDSAEEVADAFADAIRDRAALDPTTFAVSVALTANIVAVTSFYPGVRATASSAQFGMIKSSRRLYGHVLENAHRAFVHRNRSSWVSVLPGHLGGRRVCRVRGIMPYTLGEPIGEGGDPE